MSNVNTLETNIYIHIYNIKYILKRVEERKGG